MTKDRGDMTDAQKLCEHRGGKCDVCDGTGIATLMVSLVSTTKAPCPNCKGIGYYPQSPADRCAIDLREPVSIT